MLSSPPPHDVRGIFVSDGIAPGGSALWHAKNARNQRIAQVVVRPGTEDDARRLLTAFLDLQDPLPADVAA